MTVRRSTIAASLLAATLLTGWSAGTTWIILGKDSFAGQMIKRETARQYVYEDRIAALKSEIDKLSSRQLVNQDSVEARVAELVTRQSQLETRHAIVAALAEGANGLQPGSGRQARAAATPQAPAAAQITSSISSFAPATRPMPVPDMPGLRRDSDRRSTSTSTSASASTDPWEQSALEPEPRIEERLDRVNGSIAAVSSAQLKALNRIETSVTAAQTTLKSVVDEIGLDVARLVPQRSSAQGGPFIPANLDPRAGTFEASVVRLQPRIAAVERLRSVVTTLPLRRPMGPESEQTSAFGHRLDPFTRALAMHSGIDFRAEQGTPVRAGGPGRVVTADYSGGYGNMVEIDHGHGITTRYAHLSQISVSEGQQIEHGGIVGRVGSTGRSTGPHLHYETRLDGEAVDPVRFLKAGQRLKAQPVSMR